MPSCIQLNLYISVQWIFLKRSLPQAISLIYVISLTRPWHSLALPSPFLCCKSTSPHPNRWLFFSHSVTFAFCLILVWMVYIFFSSTGTFLTLLFSGFSPSFTHSTGLSCILVNMTFWSLFYSVIYYPKYDDKLFDGWGPFTTILSDFL